MGSHVQVSHPPTPREKIIDIERRLVRPMFSQHKVHLPRLYEMFMERMTNNSYQLTASQTTERRKSCRRISYPSKQRSRSPSCEAEFIVHDYGGFQIAYNDSAHLLWSTERKKRKNSAGVPASVMNWPSQELKEMRTYSKVPDLLSENMAANGIRRSDNITSRFCEREISPNPSYYVHTNKQLAESNSDTKFRAKHIDFTELKATPRPNTSWSNRLGSNLTTRSQQVSWPKTVKVHNMKFDQGPSNTVATNNLNRMFQKKTEIWLRHTANSSRNKRIKVQTNDQEITQSSFDLMSMTEVTNIWK
uniref:Uncharacterized protein n=2 Tax=Physcomitrium patens TaxID=3218 RepID=A0A7I4FS15_PHYPA